MQDINKILKPSKETAKHTANILNNSGVIVYPTETLYGLGCLALDTKAIKKIFEIKERMHNKPLLVLVKDIDMIEEYFHISNKFLNAYKKLEGKPLSIILEQKFEFPGLISANTGKIGVRISSNSFVKMLFEYVDKPITSTSANISGSENIYDFEQVSGSFEDKVDLLIDSGNLPPSNGSTIVDLTQSQPKLIREGDVRWDDIKEFF